MHLRNCKLLAKHDLILFALSLQGEYVITKMTEEEIERASG